MQGFDSLSSGQPGIQWRASIISEFVWLWLATWPGSGIILGAKSCHAGAMFHGTGRYHVAVQVGRLVLTSSGKYSAPESRCRNAGTCSATLAGTGVAVLYQTFVSHMHAGCSAANRVLLQIRKRSWIKSERRIILAAGVFVSPLSA